MIRWSSRTLLTGLSYYVTGKLLCRHHDRTTVVECLDLVQVYRPFSSVRLPSQRRQGGVFSNYVKTTKGRDVYIQVYRIFRIKCSFLPVMVPRVARYIDLRHPILYTLDGRNLRSTVILVFLFPPNEISDPPN